MMQGSEKVHAPCGEYPYSVLILSDIVATVQAAVIAMSETVRLGRSIR
jgi:hypothetical protein